MRCWQDLDFEGSVLGMKREVEMAMLKLVDGARILRLSEPESGLCLEKRLDREEPVLRQQRHWKHVFEAMLERELGTVG